MKSIMNLFLVIAVIVSSSGCAVNRTSAMVDPSSDLARIKSVHVIKVAKDERRVDLLIADNLRSRGLKVTTGPEKALDVDANVTYVDKWMWDITMYMLELTIAFRDSATYFPLATGNSYHTSLTRKSPKEMVDEVMDNIYIKGRK